MKQKELINLAENIISGKSPEQPTYKALADIPAHNAFDLFAGADIIRNFYFGRQIHLCTICNAKSGKCSEDCSFCSQSAFAKTDAPVYPLMEKSELQKVGLYALNNSINRYSIVTIGKRLPKNEVIKAAQAVSQLNSENLGKCASLGILDSTDFEILKNAGINRYHHNLETAESHFNNICSTHTYKERIETIKAAKKAGMSVCAGGIFGIGETDQQALELALTLKKLDVDSVPVNFLVPIKGTAKQNSSELTPLRCLKLISLFRYILPDKDIIICGGREDNLKQLHPLIFYAGASGIMTGNYLTTKGRTLKQDLEMTDILGFEKRQKNNRLCKFN